MEDRRLKRAWHRVTSGLEYGRGEVRLLTLTSSPDSPRPIRKSWELVAKWMRRRGIVFQYYGVVETNVRGLQHMHILFRGPYLHQWCLSNLWRKYHRAYIVDVRRTYGAKRSVGSYLCKYLVKAMGEGLSVAFSHAYGVYLDVPAFPDKLRNMWSASRDWCYPRFTRVWKAAVGMFCRSNTRVDFKVLFGLWWLHLQGDATPAKFLRWCSDVCGFGLGPPYFAISAAVAGNAGYFGSRERLGYETAKL
jgi:hypothetical protein